LSILAFYIVISIILQSARQNTDCMNLNMYLCIWQYCRRLLIVAENLALMRIAMQSSTHTFQSPAFSVDGTTIPSCTGYETSPWWSVDLGRPVDVGRVCVKNHGDPRIGRLHNAIQYATSGSLS